MHVIIHFIFSLIFRRRFTVNVDPVFKMALSRVQKETQVRFVHHAFSSLRLTLAGLESHWAQHICCQVAKRQFHQGFFFVSALFELLFHSLLISMDRNSPFQAYEIQQPSWVIDNRRLAWGGGFVKMIFPIKGSTGSAVVSVFATKEAGTYVLRQLGIQTVFGISPRCQCTFYPQHIHHEPLILYS